MCENWKLNSMGQSQFIILSVQNQTVTIKVALVSLYLVNFFGRKVLGKGMVRYWYSARMKKPYYVFNRSK